MSSDGFLFQCVPPFFAFLCPTIELEALDDIIHSIHKTFNYDENV